MGDELKTILEIGGDASGAERAAEQAKGALQSVEQAAGQAGAGAPVAEAAQQTTTALEGQAAATEKTAEATDDLNQGLDLSKRDLLSLAGALASIDPRLATIIRDFARLRGLLAILSNPTLLTGAGIAAAAAVIVVAFNAVSSSLEEAKRHLDEVAEGMERVRQAGKEVEGQVAKAMAAAGQPIVATPVATGIAKRLEEAGIERATAAKVVPFFVTKTGEKLGTPEEQEQIAAGIQAGIVKPMEGATPEARRRSFERARQAVQRHAEAIRNASAQYREQRFWRDAAAGGLTEIQQVVERELGLTGDAAAELAKRISRQAREGPKRLPRVPGGEHLVSESDVAEWLANRGILERVPAEPEEPLLRIIRQRAGVAQLPLPAPIIQPAATPAAAMPPPATQPAPTPQITENNYNYNFHGPTYVGRPGDRFTTRERVPQ